MTYREMLVEIFDASKVEYSITEYSRDKHGDVHVILSFGEFNFDNYGIEYESCYRGILYNLIKVGYGIT